MKKLSVSEFDHIFDNLWNSLEFDFFKVETLQNYKTEDEDPILQSFKSGQIDKSFFLLKEYLSNEVSPVAHKILMHRVHIIKKPLSPYIKFEFLAYKISQELGEKIFLVNWNDIAQWYKAKSLEPIDFLMFDNKVVISQIYNDEGSLKECFLYENDIEIENFKELKKELLKIASPFKYHDSLIT